MSYNVLMDVIDFLSKPEAYPHPVKQIKLIQTHISWVFLTGEFVYKIKKPVDFGFLDFTTLEKRHFFCKEEIKLNRRFSPEIYLSVVPIVKRNNAFFIDGEGKIVDYAVKMKQLPQTACVTHLLEKDKITPTIMQAIAKKMADFYLKAETNREIATYGLPEKIEINIKENFDQTASYTSRTIPEKIYNALKEYSFSFLEKEKDRFLKRITAGQIKDGHGDFHCANIYWHQGKAYILDCIEFNKRFRYADVAADVAFLLMDLDFRQASFWGNNFLNTFLAQTNDFSLLGVLTFYKIYRAYVRGKIKSFETDMQGISTAQKEAATRQARVYFELAYSYLSQPCSPRILAVTGLLGSGKTTLALALAARLGAIVIRSDAVRKHLVGAKPDTHLYAPFGKGVYTKEMTERVYESLISLAEEILGYGFPVILDASFNKEIYREKVRALSQKMGCPYLFLYCQCEEEIIKNRLQQRQKKGEDISDAYLGLFETFKKSFEPLRDENKIIVDTGQPIERTIQEIMNVLK